MDHGETRTASRGSRESRKGGGGLLRRSSLIALPTKERSRIPRTFAKWRGPSCSAGRWSASTNTSKSECADVARTAAHKARQDTADHIFDKSEGLEFGFRRRETNAMIAHIKHGYVVLRFRTLYHNLVHAPSSPTPTLSTLLTPSLPSTTHIHTCPPPILLLLLIPLPPSSHHPEFTVTCPGSWRHSATPSHRGTGGCARVVAGTRA